MSSGSLAGLSLTADFDHLLALAATLQETARLVGEGRQGSILAGVLLGPIVSDLSLLSQACAASAGGYEQAEAAIGPMCATALAGAVSLLPPLLGAGEAGVSVAASGGGTGPAAVGLKDLLDRLQRAGSSTHIIVEATGSEYTMYLPGTAIWGLNRDDSAFDITSDLSALTGPGLAASERAALQALAASGFGAGDTLTIVGHSQGALIGANIAAAGVGALGGRVKALVSVGGPIGVRKLPQSVKLVALENRNDPVPKLDLAAPENRGNHLTERLPARGESGHDLADYRANYEKLPAAERAELDRALGPRASGTASLTRYEAVRASAQP